MFLLIEIAPYKTKAKPKYELTNSFSLRIILPRITTTTGKNSVIIEVCATPMRLITIKYRLKASAVDIPTHNIDNITFVLGISLNCSSKIFDYIYR